MLNVQVMIQTYLVYQFNLNLNTYNNALLYKFQNIFSKIIEKRLNLIEKRN
jgi:hypothetical protein